MVRGEIYLAKFPLAGKIGMKIRPVLLLTDPVGPVPELLTAYISSVIPDPIMPSDLVLDPSQAPFAQTNLKTVSVARLHKLATLHQRDLIRKLGELSPAAIVDADSRLRTLLRL